MMQLAFCKSRPLEAPIGRASDFVTGEIVTPTYDLFANEDLGSLAARDPFPIPSKRDRGGAQGDRHFDWWISGLVDYRRTHETLRECGHEFRSGRMLEIGCASGRVTRHFAYHHPELEVYCSDINIVWIDWLSRHMGRNMRPFQNYTLPHLPLEDSSLDLVTGYSVINHIDAFEEAWLLEWRRVLRPGGMLYLTLISDQTWRDIKGTHIYERKLKNDNDFKAIYNDGPIPDEKIAFYYGKTPYDAYVNDVFYSEERIKRLWGAMFDIRSMKNERHRIHAGLLMQKR